MYRHTIHAVEAGKYAPGRPLAFKLAPLFKPRVESTFEPDEED